MVLTASLKLLGFCKKNCHFIFFLILASSDSTTKHFKQQIVIIRPFPCSPVFIVAVEVVGGFFIMAIMGLSDSALGGFAMWMMTII